MSSDNIPVHRRRVAASPVFWWALITVISGTSCGLFYGVGIIGSLLVSAYFAALVGAILATRGSHRHKANQEVDTDIDNPLGKRQRTSAGPLFWRAFISVIIITLIPAALWLGPYLGLYRTSESEMAIREPIWIIAIIVTQIGTLATGVYSLRRDPPMGRGLLIGLLVMDLAGPIIAIAVFAIAVQLSGALRNF